MSGRTGKGGTGGKKETGRPKPVQNSPKPPQTNVTKDGQPSAKERVVILEREARILRKNLNIEEIKKEFQKASTQTSHMNILFYETLHDLEYRLKECESKTEGDASGNLTELKKDLENGREKIKSLEKDLFDKTTLINEKDKRLQEIEAQNDNSIHSSDSTAKLKELQSKCTMLEDKLKTNMEMVAKQTDEIEQLKKNLKKAKESSDRSEQNRQRTEGNEPAVEVTELERLRAELKTNKEMVAKQTGEIEQLKRDLNKANETQDRSAQNQQRTEGNEHTEKSRKQIDDLNTENTQLKTKMNQQEIELSTLRKELKTKEDALQESNEKVSSVGKDSGAEASAKHTKEISSLKGELAEAKSQLQSSSEKLSQKEREIEQMQKDLKIKDDKHKETSIKLSQIEVQMKQMEDEHKNKLNVKEREIQKLKTEKTTGKRGGSANVETKSLGEKYEKTENELKSAREEIDELKNRLSKVVGANIMNDNPNITDLSDENRPTKLSEKFSELYDNEWTDAYEEAEEEFHTEEKSIAVLYKSLEDVFEFCKNKSQEHASSIKSCVLTIPNSANGRPKSAKIGVTSLRLLKELRKSFAPYLIDSVFQEFVSTKKIKLAGKKSTEKFIKKCVEICWLMNSQDPPVILDTSKMIGKEFDGDRFRTYTKSGKVVDYVVWPPMLLHEGGPLLCKGVAQGKQN